tara:strand:+ start:1426 stop:2307 length:882 start_codon:yes stop_codon:yes gene_type:complete
MTKVNEKKMMINCVPGVPATDGAGVKLTRMIGTVHLGMVDPFLMLDRIDSDDPASYIAGFPDHPHRGFETVTIVHEGLIRHKDSVGNEGVIGPGDVQWMTAGSGIIHSEIPEMIEGRLSGFQLWVNLPSYLKMCGPSYQDISATEVPVLMLGGVTVRVIAGTYDRRRGAARPKIAARILDVVLEENVSWSIESPLEMNLFMCVYSGSINAEVSPGQNQEVTSPSVLLFDQGGKIEIDAGESGARLLYCEGEPLNEPVARRGPFVMNTEAELEQAAKDYSRGNLTAKTLSTGAI